MEGLTGWFLWHRSLRWVRP